MGIENMSNVDLLPSVRVKPWLWAFALAALLPVAAHADDYTEVSQLVSARQYQKALAKADHYLSSKPRDPQMLFLRGVALSESGRASEAIPVFTKITEDFPDLPEPHNNLAVLYAGQNQLDKALASLESAIQNDPNYATAQENLGDVYARLASQAYSKALQLDGNNKALPPKLAIMRTLFNSEPTGQRATVAALTAAPAKTAAPVAALAKPTLSKEQADVDTAVRRWAAAWSERDMNGYLQAYAPEFVVPGKHGRQSWEEERRQRILSKSKITVQLSDVSVTVNNDRATVNFLQNYSADKLQQKARKTLELVLNGGRWLIVRETELR